MSASGPELTDPVARLAEAKRVFQLGNELRKLGDCARAIVHYEHSRALVPSKPNTQNLAYCLDQVGRSDEAYEVYESLLADFTDELSADERRAVAGSLDLLRRRLALLHASANVDGLLVVDGRNRGKLPLGRDVRLQPGEHTVRVLKDGWESYEKTITLAAGEAAVIDARLSPLAESGRLRVADPRLVGADLYVDGALVGQLPWEGTLAPGPHYYSVLGLEEGSAPREANVVRGQVTQATVESGPLAGELLIVAYPRSAELTIDAVPVGHGTWRGRLPVGRHRIEASEPGYFAYTSRPTIDATNSGEMPIKLQVDENHPRWGKKQGTFWLSAFGGFAFSGSLGSDAEEKCQRGGEERCPSPLRDMPKGGFGGLRGGYEFPNGISAFASIGYLSLHTSFDRKIQVDVAATEPAGSQIDTLFTIHDDIDLHGPYFFVGTSYRYEIAPWLFASASLAIGSLFAETRDNQTVTATAGPAGTAPVTLPVDIFAAGDPLASAAPFLLPELSLGVQVGRYFGEIGFGVFQVLVPGPPHETRDVNVRQQKLCTEELWGTPHCIRNPTVLILTEEVAYGTFTAFMPRLGGGVRF
ncbi:MAG: PEGA domain-containing protein [Polyangiaceae bacterium]